MKIVVSNQLDEYVIKSLLDQGAPIDVFGVGTNLVTGQPDGALDGVYKLSMSAGMPRLKLSDSLAKVTLPGVKEVYRAYTAAGGFAGADAIVLADEPRPATMYHPFEPDKSLALGRFTLQPLLHKVMSGGERLGAPKALAEIAAYAVARLSLLSSDYRRFENPHIYKVGVSKQLLDLRNDMTRHARHTSNG